MSQFKDALDRFNKFTDDNGDTSTTIRRALKICDRLLQEPSDEMQSAYFDVIDAVAERVNSDPLYGRYSANKEAYKSMINQLMKEVE